MEKTKLTVFDVLHNWKKLNVAQKRAFLTVALFALAALLLLVALILGVASCRAKTASQANAGSTAPIPALLQPPKQAEEQIPDGNETTDPDRIDDPADGTDEPGGETGAEATASPAPGYQVLKKHDSGEEVTKLQTRLMELGYLEIEEPTDYFGSSTEYAVSLFQRQHELQQDGIAGEQTQTLLFSKEAKHYTLLEGAEGRDVKLLQEQLVELGYLASGEVDRIYGEKTIDAVKAFQKRNGLTQDGKAGEKTLEKLFSDDAKMSKAMEEKVKAEEKAAKTTPKATQKSGSKTQKPGSKTTPKPTKKPTPTPKKDTKIDKFIKAANSKIGCEYVLGDSGPKTFDCSGFVTWCLRQAGVSTKRLNAEGFSKVSRWKNITKLSDLKRGDILFFKSDSSSRVSHTGIYIGSNTMIDASSSHGKVVKRALSAYFKRNFVNARRPWE
jgi:peptidoglycan hydrolase-like protein with peptidoglycan-binding domain